MGPTLEVQDGRVTVCVRGRIESDEKGRSTDASHKKFSDMKLAESRAKKNGRA